MANTDIDKKGNNYQPVTIRVYNSEDELEVFLKKIGTNQEITYANSFKFENYDKKIFTERPMSISLDQRKEMIDRINSVAHKVNGIPSFAKEFSFMMSKLSNSYQKINNNVAVYRALVSAINDGIVLSPDQITEDICDYDTLGYDLTALVNACNDLICSNGGNTNNTSEAYSTIQQENSQLKKELIEMKKQLQEIKQQNQTLIEE